MPDETPYEPKHPTRPHRVAEPASIERALQVPEFEVGT